MSEWQKRKLGELCTRITVGHVGSMASRYTESGILFLRSLNIKPGRIDLSAVKYIDENFHRELMKSQLKPGDLAIVRTGEPGTTALIPDGLGPLNCSDVIIATPRSDVDARFLCYAINETAQEFVKAHTVGAVQQHFNVRSAKELELHLPNFTHQQAISDVLWALDGKIGVNERIAATADTLSDTIFRSRTQHHGRTPMSKVLSPILGGTPDRKIDSYWGGNIPWASVKDVVNTTAGVLLSTEEQITETAMQNSRAKRLQPGSVVLTARGTVGAVARIAVPAAINQSCYAFEPGRVPSPVLFHVVRSAAGHMHGMAHGTVFSTVNMKTFDHVEIPDLQAGDLRALSDELSPLHQLIESHLRGSRTLAALRDTLLPQLMSGRLRVKDAEKIVEDHV